MCGRALCLADVVIESALAPSGLSIFSNRTGGITVAEAGVPTALVSAHRGTEAAILAMSCKGALRLSLETLSAVHIDVKSVCGEVQSARKENQYSLCVFNLASERSAAIKRRASAISVAA